MFLGIIHTLYRMTSFSDKFEPEGAVMVLQPGYEVMTWF